MSYQLKEKTKQMLSERMGIPYEKLVEMTDEEIDSYIEQKTGKKITWPEDAKINGISINTLENAERKMKKAEEDLER